MIDWIQLLVNYWWVLVLVFVGIIIVTRIHNFFQFFTTLVTMVALVYAATIIFFPPTDKVPTAEISKVLGVSTDASDSTPSADSPEGNGVSLCSQTINSGETLVNCVKEWAANIQMPDFNALLGQHITIKYNEPSAAKAQ